ncbi:MAG TPA: serine/threonine-protein kinase [Anaeromyxobacteraceae bacterium]|nr:serine/threonine-protein kinase [Anaeromyxobacteraceae bacterium]
MNRSASFPLPGAPSTADLTHLVGVKLGNYRLERLIGRGRMGVVYLANDVALLRPTAVKVLSWSAAEAQGQDPVQWFLAEARLVARINHPRVVQIYGAARHGGYCYIAMEYVPGQSVEAALAECGTMPPERATDVLLQAASALHAAHRSGVVHRDVKPANLLIGSDGVTKLGDFGMAFGAAGAPVGQARVRAGTPYYTAPEVWRGEPATAASDIYSLGATYFELLTGRPPFPGTDVAAVEQAHLRAPVPDPREVAPGLPASCAALLQRALAKSPRERHASAQLLAQDGRQVLQELTAAGESVAGPRTRTPPSPPARRPLSPVEGLLASELGFAHRPFFTADPSACAPLAREQVPAYVRSWVEATLAPHAAPIVFSPDALRLMALRSEGALPQLDCIAENMLVLAAAGHCRTLTSWHAWAASDRERWSVQPPPTALPTRPAHWPPPDVIAVLDACRRGAGVPPWPRASRAVDAAVAVVGSPQIPSVATRRGDP